MKALVLEQNGRLKYNDVPMPQMAEDECLLAVKAAGVCSSDILRAFANGAYFYPLIMGHEFSGEIIECGPKVSNFVPGQQVAVFPLLPCFECPACLEKRWVHCRSYSYYGSRRHGAFCEYISVKSWNLIPIPEGCDVELASLCEPLAVCVHTLNAIPNDCEGTLAIIGAGFMGLCLAKVAQRSGQFSQIWLLDRNQFKLDIARDWGFSTILLNSDRQSKLFSGQRFNVVIEACGAVETYRLSTAICAHSGQVIWMGNIAGDFSLTQKQVSSILRREISIHGVWNSEFQPGELCEWTDSLDLIAHDSWIRDLVSHRVSLAEGKAILEDLCSIKKEHRPHSYLKVCFRFK